MTVEAEFDSKCPICGEGIVAGVDLIRRDMDGSWSHESCADEQEDAAAG